MEPIQTASPGKRPPRYNETPKMDSRSNLKMQNLRQTPGPGQSMTIDRGQMRTELANPQFLDGPPKGMGLNNAIMGAKSSGQFQGMGDGITRSR